MTKKYFDDPFICEMEPNQPHKVFLPLINRGTYTRVYSINNSVNNIVASVPKEQNINIIVLGSGFDTMYFNLANKGITNVNFYELDYEKIINKKKQIIASSQKLSQIAANAKNYSLIPCDLTKMSSLKKKFISIIPKEHLSDLTLIICECLLVYIERETTVEFLSFLHSQFENVVLLEYDLTGANDSFGKEMVDNLKMRNIELKGFKDVPEIKDQIERLKECKFDTVDFVTLYDVYNKMIPNDERKRVDMLEMMDEFEEFDLLQRHACFGYGITLKDKEKYAKIEEILKFAWKK